VIVARCPKCGYPDTFDGQHFKGIYTPGEPCSHCDAVEGEGDEVKDHVHTLVRLADEYGCDCGVMISAAQYEAIRSILPEGWRLLTDAEAQAESEKAKT